MLIILGTIRVAPERLPEARIIMAGMVTASRAEEGCIHYAYAEDVLDKGLIRVSEVWRDQAALDAHFQMPHLHAWRAEWAKLDITDRRLFAYDAENPRAV